MARNPHERDQQQAMQADAQPQQLAPATKAAQSSFFKLPDAPTHIPEPEMDAEKQKTVDGPEKEAVEDKLGKSVEASSGKVARKT